MGNDNNDDNNQNQNNFENMSSDDNIDNNNQKINIILEICRAMTTMMIKNQKKINCRQFFWVNPRKPGKPTNDKKNQKKINYRQFFWVNPRKPGKPTKVSVLCCCF